MGQILVLERWPWAAVGCSSLYSVLKRDPQNLTIRLNFRSVLVCTSGKCPILVMFQPFLLPECTQSTRAPAPTGNLCAHKLHCNSCYYLSSYGSFTVQLNDRNHFCPSSQSSLGCLSSVPLKTLSTGVARLSGANL